MKFHHLAPLALAAAMVTASGAAFAQTSPAPAAGADSQTQPGMAPAPGAPKRGHRLDHALGELGLSSDQQSKIRSYREAYRASQSSATPETRKAYMTQITSVLTPDQLARFKTAMHHRRMPQPAATS